MVYVMEPRGTETGAEAEPDADARKPIGRNSFGCVYLTRSIRDANLAAALAEPSKIRIYHATGLDEGRVRLRQTRSRVLMTDTEFDRGDWKDALEMTVHLRPPTALVVASRLADEKLWIGVLEHGAYDLIVKPFQGDELRRILENAHEHAASGALLHMTA